MSIAENLHTIERDIELAVSRRKCLYETGKSIQLIVVTKNQTVAAVSEAIEAGATAIGENRVQEAHGKFGSLPQQAQWHLIGHLQTNKVRQAVSMFNLIHSVDSERLALEIDRVAGVTGKRQDILIQVNIADEKSKFGVSPAGLPDLAKLVSSLRNTRLCGLMSIAPFFADAEEARTVFREAYQLFKQLKDMNLTNATIQWLSMGMSNDYSVAIEEGANMVRIGTAVFGPRHY